MRHTNGANRFFVDTRVHLYSVDAAVPQKQNAARLWLDLLWKHSAGRLSWQVLNEFYVNAVRKMGTPPRQVRTAVETFALWKPVNTTPGLAQRAWQWTDQAQLSYRDALILAAAEYTGCACLLSEDFSAGRRYGAVTVVNPFRESVAAFGLAHLPR